MTKSFLTRMQDLKYDWPKWARREQLLPLGEWFVWLILAGRGWGKTRTLSETARVWTRTNPIVNIAGATLDDVRSILIEGPAGIMAICPKAERPVFTKSKRLLTWPNGSKSELFSGEEPDRWRGPQCHKLICDELASWRNQQECWDNAMLGLRQGDLPQVAAATTPRPTRLIRELAASEHTYLTQGITADNAGNLAATFLTKITERFRGTRLGEQELMGRILADREGALWTYDMIDGARLTRAPDDLDQVVVAIDPATTSHKRSDETGIVVAARDRQKPRHYYVLADLSCVTSPDGWARRAVAAYRSYGASKIIGEGNMGGDLIGATVHHIDPNITFKKVHATRGKALRAEPISALYEQSRVRHIGTFSALEDQMTDWTPDSNDSPDRLDALVWALTELSEGGSDFMSGWFGQAIERFSELKKENPGVSSVELVLRHSLVPNAEPFNLAAAQMREQGKRGDEVVFKKDRGTFGALKGLSVSANRMKDTTGRRTLPATCPNCQRPVAIYADGAHCNACAWDSKAATTMQAAKPQPERLPAMDEFQRARFGF